MKKRKYFISYNFGTGFGHSLLDSPELTKKNCREWITDTIKGIEKELKKDNTIMDKIIILNIVEIK